MIRRIGVPPTMVRIHFMELEPPTGYTPPPDKRPHLPPPPPVSLLAVEDVRLPAAAGDEAMLDRFYVGILKFERDAESSLPVYHADNFDLHFEIGQARRERDDFRMLGVALPSLTEVMHRLIDAEMQFTRQRAVAPGREAIVVLDPAGNWVEITEKTNVR